MLMLSSVSHDDGNDSLFANFDKLLSLEAKYSRPSIAP